MFSHFSPACRWAHQVWTLPRSDLSYNGVLQPRRPDGLQYDRNELFIIWFVNFSEGLREFSPAGVVYVKSRHI